MEANPQMESANTSEEIQVSLEQIYQWNPDVIITKTEKGREEILSKNSWKDIAAVRINVFMHLQNMRCLTEHNH